MAKFVQERLTSFQFGFLGTVFGVEVLDDAIGTVDDGVFRHCCFVCSRLGLLEFVVREETRLVKRFLVNLQMRMTGASDEVYKTMSCSNE